MPDGAPQVWLQVHAGVLTTLHVLKSGIQNTWEEPRLFQSSWKSLTARGSTRRSTFIILHLIILINNTFFLTCIFQFSSICTLNGVGLPSVGHAIRENQCILPIQEILQLALYSLLKQLGLRHLVAENLKVTEQIAHVAEEHIRKLGSANCAIGLNCLQTFEKENLCSATPTPFSLLFKVAEPFGAFRVTVWMFSITTQF